MFWQWGEKKSLRALAFSNNYDDTIIVNKNIFEELVQTWDPGHTIPNLWSSKVLKLPAKVVLSFAPSGF